MLLYFLFSFLLINFNTVKGANILAVLPLNGKSHFLIAKPILEKLAKRGHSIDVLSHFPRKEKLNGYVDFSLEGTLPLVHNIDVNKIQKQSNLQNLQFIFHAFGENVCKAVSTNQVTKDLKASSKKYDLVLTELFFTDCMIGFGHLFNVPIIGIISSVNLPWTSDILGVPDNPSYIPNYFTPYASEMSVFERFENVISLAMAKIWYNYYAMEISNRYYQKFFGNQFHLRDVVKNYSLIMVNSHFTMHQSRPLPANFIEIGGIHINESLISKPSENHLPIKSFLSNQNGIIYLSFGTVFTSENFPEDTLKIFFDVLRNLPYKILWKGDRFNISKHLPIPENFEFIKWAPQLEILCDSNVKLFISHSGLLGTQEAIYCAKPILAIPIWADQLMNANIIKKKGIGLVIPFFQLTKNKLTKALDELLNNDLFKEKTKILSELFKDRPQKPLETAIYWIEYVIKHKDVSHLRSKSADLSWFVYYCLDIMFIIFLFICGTFGILYWIYFKIKKLLIRKQKIL